MAELLEEGDSIPLPPPDLRRPMPVPPPVRLVAVADVTLPIPAGHEMWLDIFYAGVLLFDIVDVRDPAPKVKYEETLARPADAGERLPGKERAAVAVPGPRTYRAENLTLRYEIVGALSPELIRAITIEVPVLEDVARRMFERRISYERVRGLLPGIVYLLVTDPAGHLVNLYQGRDLPL